MQGIHVAIALQLCCGSTMMRSHTCVLEAGAGCSGCSAADHKGRGRRGCLSCRGGLLHCMAADVGQAATIWCWADVRAITAVIIVVRMICNRPAMTVGQQPSRIQPTTCNTRCTVHIAHDPKMPAVSRWVRSQMQPLALAPPALAAAGRAAGRCQHPGSRGGSRFVLCVRLHFCLQQSAPTAIC
jgi:hypothetical protein